MLCAHCDVFYGFSPPLGEVLDLFAVNRLFCKFLILIDNCAIEASDLWGTNLHVLTATAGGLLQRQTDDGRPLAGSIP